jgi:hypothetical protein
MPTNPVTDAETRIANAVAWSDERLATIADLRTLLASLATLRAENARLTDALTEIANTDYRGNRSHESQLAYRALATRAPQGRTE